MNPSGSKVRIAAGDYAATVVTVGAGLAQLTWQDHALVVGHEVSELPPGYLGKTLLPWPNRIAGGRYHYAGQCHELPVNEHSTGAALHGLVCWTDWEVTRATATEVCLTTDVKPRYGYPFWLRATATYRLDPAAGLTVTITSVNLGATPAPYGASSHPYLTCDLAPVDECTLRLPARTMLGFDERLAPTTLAAVSGDFDLRAGPLVADRQIDHAYTGLPPGRWSAVLHHAASGLTSRLHADARWAQVYTGELLDRRGVALEPMSCPPDAFNSGTDLVELAPGDAHSLQFTIDAGAIG